jgi:2-oxo-4-hydroxy-4-carboxy--5-ureidoimidazoline (OHCU) decarboxylase
MKRGATDLSARDGRLEWGQSHGDSASKSTMSLQPWKELNDEDLSTFLSYSLGILFESSDILEAELVPNLAETIMKLSPESRPTSYSELIDLSLRDVGTWDDLERAAFIAGHPRIGEVKGLSELSAAEQASKVTPPEVLARLEYLNSQYEKAFPGLRYITYVRGRSRAEIIPEMEAVLELDTGEEQDVGIYFSGTDEWIKELDRAIGDVGLIAKARVQNMGLE